MIGELLGSIAGINIFEDNSLPNGQVVQFGSRQAMNSKTLDAFKQQPSLYGEMLQQDMARRDRQLLGDTWANRFKGLADVQPTFNPSKLNQLEQVTWMLEPNVRPQLEREWHEKQRQKQQAPVLTERQRRDQFARQHTP